MEQQLVVLLLLILVKQDMLLMLHLKMVICVFHVKLEKLLVLHKRLFHVVQDISYLLGYVQLVLQLLRPRAVTLIQLLIT